MFIFLQILLEISNFFLARQPASPQKICGLMRAEQVRAAGYAGWPKIAAGRAEVRVGLSPTTSLSSFGCRVNISLKSRIFFVKKQPHPTRIKRSTGTRRDKQYSFWNDFCIQVVPANEFGRELTVVYFFDTLLHAEFHFPTLALTHGHHHRWARGRQSGGESGKFFPGGKGLVLRGGNEGGIFAYFPINFKISLKNGIFTYFSLLNK